MSNERHPDSSEQAHTLELTRQAGKRPRRFVVILHNDDYTTMEFVIAVLARFFARTETEATRIMLEVHHKGRGVAGVYLRDIAESKVEQVEEFARAEGHPLKCTAEPYSGSDEESSHGPQRPDSHDAP